jgi:hypothetical protein
MTSPAICIFKGDEFSFDRCKFYFVTNRLKLNDVFCKGKITGILMPEYKNDIDRFDILSDYMMDSILYNCRSKGISIGLEDYAMGARGRVFGIGENTGILKYKLREYPLFTYPPTVIKKFATGKGNSNKEVMYDYFTKETGVDLRDSFPSKSEKIGNPISDIIDSYYICKKLYHEINTEKDLTIA